MPLLLLVALLIVANFATDNTAAAVVDSPTVVVPSLAATIPTSNASVWFAPCSDNDTASVVHRIASNFSAATAVPVLCFPCESGCAGALLDAYRWPGDGMFAAVVVDNASLPFTYRMLLNAVALAPGAGSSAVTPLYDVNGLVLPPNAAALSAYVPNVAALQLAVERAASVVIAAAAGVPAPPTVALAVRAFPWPAYDDSVIFQGLVYVVPIYMTLIFTLQVGCAAAEAAAAAPRV